MNDYESFKKQIYTLSSIDLDAYKEKQMKRRIDSLISKNGFKGYDEYVRGLKTDKELYAAFINYLTINVSEFWRNPEQWAILEKDIIPYLMKKHGRNIKYGVLPALQEMSLILLLCCLQNFYRLIR